MKIGFLIEVNNINEVSEKIKMLINNPSILEKISDNAKEIFATHNIEYIYNRYYEFLFKMEEE